MASITFISLFALLVTYSYSLPVVQQNVPTPSQIKGAQGNPVNAKPVTSFSVVESTTVFKRSVGDDSDSDEVTTPSKRLVEPFDVEVTTPSKRGVEPFDVEVTTPSKRGVVPFDVEVTTPSKRGIVPFDVEVTTPSKRSVDDDTVEVTTPSKRGVEPFDVEVTTPSKRGVVPFDVEVTTPSKRGVEPFTAEVTTPETATLSKRSASSDSSESNSNAAVLIFVAGTIEGRSDSVSTQSGATTSFGQFSTPTIESSTEFNQRAMNLVQPGEVQQTTTFVPQIQSEVTQETQPSSSGASFAKSTRFINAVQDTQFVSQTFQASQTSVSSTSSEDDEKKKRAADKITKFIKGEQSTTVQP